MTIESVGAHEWTREWFESLPNAYQLADAATRIPPELLSITLNTYPRLAPEFDRWTSSAPVQGSDWVEYRLSRGFRYAEMGDKLHFQVWWEAAVTGGTATLELTGPGGTAVPQTVPIAAGDGQAHVEVTFFTETTFTATLLLRLPVGTGQDFGIKAITVSRNLLDLTDIPDGENRYYPMLRFMEGPGSIAGMAEDISDAMWDGRLLDPYTAPDAALRFIAMLMGLPVAQRSDNPAVMRSALVTLLELGRPPIGTRANIEDAVGRFLTGDRSVAVVPTPGKPFVLTVMVAADEVPGYGVPPNEFAVLENLILNSGALPAGHVVKCIEATSFWSAWDSGFATWADKEAAITTWIKAQSYGVVFPE